MRWVGVLVVLMSVVLSGCSAPLGGGATGSGPSAAPTTPGRPNIVLPPRPREVRLEGVDPCTLFTTEQRAVLGLDGRPVPLTGRYALYNGGVAASCTTRGSEPRAVAVGLVLSVTGGVELFTNRSANAWVTAVDIAGFPAVLVVPDRYTDFCSVVVDVAPGHAFDVLFSDGSRSPPIPQPDLCASAEQAAELAMGTLLAQR